MVWHEDKKNKFGLSVIKTIAELVMSDTEANFFLWYDERSKTNWWWNICSNREAPLAMGMDVGSATAAEI